jgi:hypothetical protein
MDSNYDDNNWMDGWMDGWESIQDLDIQSDIYLLLVE